MYKLIIIIEIMCCHFVLSSCLVTTSSPDFDNTFETINVQIHIGWHRHVKQFEKRTVYEEIMFLV